ncbi:hypothetical protein ACU4GD_10740 [Cupriavidus basilensis]
MATAEHASPVGTPHALPQPPQLAGQPAMAQAGRVRTTPPTWPRIRSHPPAGGLRRQLAARAARLTLTAVASRLTAQYFRRLALERAYLEALALQPEATAPSPRKPARWW